MHLKHSYTLALLSIVVLTAPLFSFAQMMTGTTMMNGASSSGALNSDEAKGASIWQQFRDGKISCEHLSNEDFKLIGEFLMDQMMGTAHEAMNTYLDKSVGAQGEAAMHATMAKRLTNCDPNAAWPTSVTPGDFGVINMMMGGWYPSENQLREPGFARYALVFAGLGFFFSLLRLVLWAFAIWGIVSFGKWLWAKWRHHASGPNGKP